MTNGEAEGAEQQQEQEQEQQQEQDGERDKRLGQAYSAATRRLREKHREEFNAFMKDEAADRGIEWTAKLTPEERALSEIERYLSEFPNLAERLAERLVNEAEEATSV